MKKYVLITGASSGIGEATARRLADENCDLILLARRKEKLDSLANDLKTKGVDVLVQQLDITDTKALEAYFLELSTLSIQGVINNAGMALGKDPLDAADSADLQAMIDLNVSAFLHVAYLSIPHLKKTKGHLINLGSIAGKEVYVGGATYCATKYFVHAINEGLRLDLSGSGVRVTEIAPGAVETEFSAVRFKGDTQRASKVYQGYIPLRPEDIADAIWYAMSRPEHVNIQQLIIMPTAQASATTTALSSK